MDGWKSSIIWPIFHHLLPIMVKLFISSPLRQKKKLSGQINYVKNQSGTSEKLKDRRGAAESGIHLMIEALPACSPNEPRHETKFIPYCPKSDLANSRGTFSFNLV